MRLIDVWFLIYKYLSCLQLQEYRATYTNCNTTAFVNDSVNGSCQLLGNEEDFPTCADYVSNISRFGRDQRNDMNLCLCYCEVSYISITCYYTCYY